MSVVADDVPLARLVIVDDEPTCVDALCDALSIEGYSTIGFTRPLDALAILQRERFDILVTDLAMPQMNGIELLNAAQKIDRELVGIVMSGHATIDSAVHAMRTGALDYITKPFQLSAILPVLSRARQVHELRVHNAELLQTLTARTAELETANHMLEGTNRELQAFTHSVAHDLRAPLRGIALQATTLTAALDSTPLSNLRVLSDKILGKTLDMGQMIDDMLHFSECSHQALNCVQVDVTNLARELFDSLLPQESARRKIALTIDELPPAFADAALIRQVLENLASNALKFTRQRGIAEIRVTGESADEWNSYSVRDNGAGFDMYGAADLFGLFRRLHHRDEFPGTGVGLSIVRRIVERHGGTISAKARPNEGATFTFTLPKGGGPPGHARPADTGRPSVMSMT